MTPLQPPTPFLHLEHMNRATTTFPKAILLLVVSFGLLMVLAMYYQLWWKRDRVLYSGKSPSEQRGILFERSGMNPEILASVEATDIEWPSGISYRVEGESLNRSYVEYLLAPRVPSGDANHTVQFDGPRCRFTSEPEQIRVVKADVFAWEGRNVLGLVASVLMVLGVACVASRVVVSLSACESIGLATGVLLICEVMSRACTQSTSRGMIVFFVLAVSGLCLSASRTKSNQQAFLEWVPVARERVAKPPRSVSLPIMVTVLLLAVVLSFVLSVIVVPDDWDAWAIWGPKAKILVQGVGPLSDVTYFGHEDYPLLWPSIWALSGWCGGGWEEQWSRGWGAVFFALTAWQLYSIVKRETGRSLAGLLTAVLFVSTPKILVVSTWSYAEAPLWFMTSLWFGRLLQGCDGGVRHAMWAGVFAALAALTKNEGVMMAGLGLLWLLAFTKENRWKCGSAYLAPVLILYGPWAWWIRERLKLGDHATEGISFSADRLHYALNRLGPAIRCWLDIWLDCQQWGVTLGILVIGSCWLLWRGTGRLRSALMIPLAMVVGCFVLILFHTAEVLWQMGTSWDRLTIQAMVPLMVLVMVDLWPRLGLDDKRAS